MFVPMRCHPRLRRRYVVQGAAGIVLTALLAACGGKGAATPVAATPTPAPPTGTTPTAPSAIPSAIAVNPAPAAVTGSPAATVAIAATAPAASGVASPARGEQEITFTSGPDTIYGSVMLPTGGQGQKLPGAIILAGSGPTDRDGNTALIPGPVNTLRTFAAALADQGVVSLRYDKVASGKTGLASHANPADIGFSLYVDEARAAYALLRARPEVDPRRVILLGHSEGGLIALVVADQLKGGGDLPKALVLAAPLGSPYLETIRRQVTEQYTQAQQAGQVTKEQADAALADLDRAIASLKQTGKVPADIGTPALKPLFNPGVEKFLAEVQAYDPRQIAAGLPPTLPALVMRGAKDQQVSAADVQNLMQGFQVAGNTRATLTELPNVNHVFKEVPGAPNPATDYGNPALRFSSEAVTRLAAFVRESV